MYQELLHPNTYKIDATEIVPAIAVLTNFQPDLDPEVYDMSFTLEGPDESGNVGVKERKAPIKCDEYIEKYLVGKVNHDQVKSFRAELYGRPGGFLCPDFSQFDLKGDTLDGSSL